MSSENLIFSLNNPIILSILLSLALLGLTYIFYVHVYLPSNRRFKLEKESLESQNNKLMALFAQLDPEPLFRFDMVGCVILVNKAGLELLGEKWQPGIFVSEIFPSLAHFNYSGIISEGKTIILSTYILNQFFDVTVKGIPEMEFGQIYCNNITERKNFENELTESRKKLRVLANHLQKLQEEEKQKISMELHDGIGQVLTSIKLNLEILKSSLTPNDRSQKHVEDLSALVESAMFEIREISYRLKPRILDDLGLIPALNSLCNEVAKKTNMKGLFLAHKIDKRLNSDMETAFYRIAQEALNNIMKHSKASEFSLQIVKHPGFIRLMVEDDGIGFENNNVHIDPAKKEGMGLINMSERAIALDGKFVIDSRKGRGTEIIVELPTEEENEYN